MGTRIWVPIFFVWRYVTGAEYKVCVTESLMPFLGDFVRTLVQHVHNVQQLAVIEFVDHAIQMDFKHRRQPPFRDSDIDDYFSKSGRSTPV